MSWKTFYQWFTFITALAASVLMILGADTLYHISYEKAVSEGTSSLLAGGPTFFVDCRDYAREIGSGLNYSSSDVEDKLEFHCQSTKTPSLFVFFFAGAILAVGGILCSFTIYSETRKTDHYFRLSWIMSLSAAASFIAMYKCLSDVEGISGLLISCKGINSAEQQSLEDTGLGFVCAFDDAGSNLETAERFYRGFELILSATSLAFVSSFIYWVALFANLKVGRSNDEVKDEIVA